MGVTLSPTAWTFSFYQGPSAFGRAQPMRKEMKKEKKRFSFPVIDICRFVSSFLIQKDTQTGGGGNQRNDTDGVQCHFLFDSPEKTKKNMNLDRRSSWHLFVTFVLFLFDLILCWRFLFLFKTRPLRLGKKNVACDVFIHTHTHTNIHNAFLRMEII
jgi:hypothetical protein